MIGYFESLLFRHIISVCFLNQTFNFELNKAIC